MRVRRNGISVVIPAHNRPDALIRALASVKSSSTDRVEIIVVDDASSIELRSLIPFRNDSGIPVRYYRFAVNRGPQAARNLGIRRSKYTYVAFLDSDDTFSSDKLDTALHEIDRESVDVLFHAVAGMDRYNQAANFWSRYLAAVIPFRWLLAVYNPVPTPALVVRRTRRLGIPSLRHTEDYAFLLRYCRSGVRAKYLDRELSTVHRPLGAAGGLSANVWHMRKGEFFGRKVLLKEGGVAAMSQYL